MNISVNTNLFSNRYTHSHHYPYTSIATTEHVTLFTVDENDFRENGKCTPTSWTKEKLLFQADAKVIDPEENHIFPNEEAFFQFLKGGGGAIGFNSHLKAIEKDLYCVGKTRALHGVFELLSLNFNTNRGKATIRVPSYKLETGDDYVPEVFDVQFSEYSSKELTISLKILGERKLYIFERS